MLLDVARRHAAGVQRDHFLVEALQATLVLLHELRIECAFPVPRNANLDGPRVGLHRLRRVTISGVARPPATLLLVPEVLGDLGLEQALHDRALELGEGALRTEEVFFRRAPFQERIDEFLLCHRPIPIRNRRRFLVFFNCFHERLLSLAHLCQLTQVF